MKLNFLGTGSAFNIKLGNNSAFIKEGQDFLLIDCGPSTFKSIIENKLLNNCNNVNILITHTHSDHIGSLCDLIFYCYYVLKIKTKIYYPGYITLSLILKEMGVGDKYYEIYNWDVIENAILKFKSIGDIEISKYRTEHVPDEALITNYAYIIKNKKYNFYYSGDSNNIDKSIFTMLKNKEIDNIYQDTCGLHYDNNPHLSLRNLQLIAPIDLRNRIYCMHLDEMYDEFKSKQIGFKTAKNFKKNKFF